MEPLNIGASCTPTGSPSSPCHYYPPDTACLAAPPDKPPTPRVGALLLARPNPWFSNRLHGTTKRNLQSALYHLEVVDQYLATEVREKRIAGPFPSGTIPATHISRFGVIPKAHQSNKWRLIVDLSHPQGKSVNNGISKELCSMTYITIDDAAQRIMGLGRGTLMAKIDIKSAFHLIPVHPADRHLLAMAWRDVVYIDTCLPFSLRSAPKIFNILADLLEWILKHLGVTFVLHYLDDFLTMGSPDTSECHHNLQLLIEVCQMLGIPLAIAKVEGPTTVLEFLGILLDTTRMEARLPENKLVWVQTTVREWISKKKATKREILSLVGLLQHAAKVVHPGRTFVRRMYSVAARVLELDYYTRLNKEFRSDLSWWQLFLNSWNGVSFLKLTAMPQVPDLMLQTDASGSWGCAAFCSGIWLQWEWPQEWYPISIRAKELVPIFLSCAVWGPRMARKSICFQCDNTGVVAAIKKGSAKEEVVMHLLRALWFFCAHFDIAITIEQLPGAQNCTADQLSRYNMHSFFFAKPQADLLPTPLPPELLQIGDGPRLDLSNLQSAVHRYTITMV